MASDYQLCGMSPDAFETKDSDKPENEVADSGEVVTCPDCQKLIDHVLASFTPRYRVKSKAQHKGPSARGGGK